ncbi:MAG: hypothetical protein E6K98_04375 [Thaumarchaeota archaeon]|nr:MAG: hypothetical protein E6K98_04375 [Nitrososphaerota archaeon]
MSDTPTETPDSIKYSEIVDMNDCWIEVIYPNPKYKCYGVVPTCRDIPKIVLKDAEHNLVNFRFKIGALILFEGDNIMWYNKMHVTSMSRVLTR